MQLWLLILLYAFIAVAPFVLLWFHIRSNRLVYAFSGIITAFSGCILSCFFAYRFNSLPGAGSMPGLTWLPHTMISLVAALFFAFELLFIGFIVLFRYYRMLKEQGKNK